VIRELCFENKMAYMGTNLDKAISRTNYGKYFVNCRPFIIHAEKMSVIMSLIRVLYSILGHVLKFYIN